MGPLLVIEPGQGLARIAPKQPIVLAVAGIEYGQRLGNASAGAASLLLLGELALMPANILIIHGQSLRTALVSYKVNTGFLFLARTKSYR